MRNLKKILAMVLALVMSLSLMTVAGATETTSADSAVNKYATAQAVLEGLDVYKGDLESGEMNYSRDVKRSEAAALLYRIATGDVKDTQAKLYSNTNFTDGVTGHWAEGYIAYCYNAEIVKGTNTEQTLYDPDGNVTGYQLMAMALRTLGYGQNGEFEGNSWVIQTAATGKREGLLKGVTAADEATLGQPASRGLVAQILFNALLQETVTFDVRYPNQYQKSGVTLGYKVFGLEEITGVVVANEYADIRRDPVTLKGNGSPVGEDETVLNVDGTDYLITNAPSKLEDLGETRIAYTVETSTKRGSHEVVGVALADAGTDAIKYDNGEEISSGSFTGKVGTLDKDAQRYLNFGETGGIDTTKVKVSYRIDSLTARVNGLTEAKAVDVFCTRFNLKASAVYNAADPDNDSLVITPVTVGSGSYDITYTPNGVFEVKGTDNTVVPKITSYTANGHTYSVRPVDSTDLTKGHYFYVEIAAGSEYTALDAELITSIFTHADRYAALAAGQVVVIGEVYVGTQSYIDYSDPVNGVAHSYEEFVTNYINKAPEHKNSDIGSNSRGWWLKAIDNDSDGYTDWVFQTRYTVAKVTKVDPDTGKLTLDTTDWLTKEGTYVDGDDNKKDIWNVSSHPDYVNYVGGNVSGVINYTGDTIEEEDLVYFAKIDGRCYAWKCEVVTGRVNAIDRVGKTVTVDGYASNPIHESAVHEHSSDVTIASEVANMSGTVTMDLYMDGFGNVAAFKQNISGKFRLLTDGWSAVQKNGTEYAVKAWNVDTQAFEQFDVSEGGNLFVGAAPSDNNWNRIRSFVPLNDNVVANDTDIHTIVAYVEDDGETAKLLPVDTVRDVERQNGREVRMIDMGKTIPNSAISYGTICSTSTLTRVPYDTVGTKNDIRVRALADTVYLYVYPSQTYQGNYNANGLYVHQITGYATGANWLNTIKDRNYIEDVYVVGTRGEDVTGQFYTANIVVVELGYGFTPDTHKDNEQVFLYNFPATTTWSTIEEVDAIRADGTNEKILVDLRASRTYTEADTAVGGGSNGDRDTSGAYYALQPGLYWLHRTPDTDTLGYYAVEHMHHGAIQNAGIYDVGTVSSLDYVQNDYVAIYDWYCNVNTLKTTSNNSHHDESLAAHKYTYGTNPFGNTVENASRKVSSGKYYTLKNSASRGYYVEETTVDVALRQWWNWGGTSYDNHNQVLVRYNSSNNVVYAISFDHTETVNKVWRSVLKDGRTVTPDTNAPVVTFYGVEDGVTNDVTGLSGDNAITVSYTTAAAGEKTIVVEPADLNAANVNSVTVSRRVGAGTPTTLTAASLKNGVYTYDISGDLNIATYVTYTVTVNGKDWTLIQLARGSATTFDGSNNSYLKGTGTKGTVDSTNLVTPTTDGDGSNEFAVTIETYAKSFKLSDVPVKEVRWLFYERAAAGAITKYANVYSYTSTYPSQINHTSQKITGITANNTASEAAKGQLMNRIVAVQITIVPESGSNTVYRTSNYTNIAGSGVTLSNVTAYRNEDDAKNGSPAIDADKVYTGDIVYLKGTGKGKFQVYDNVNSKWVDVTGGAYGVGNSNDTIYGPFTVTGNVKFEPYHYVEINVTPTTTGVAGSPTLVIADTTAAGTKFYRTDSTSAYVAKVDVLKGYKPTCTADPKVTFQDGAVNADGFVTWTVTIPGTYTTGDVIAIKIVGAAAADPAYASIYKDAGIDIKMDAANKKVTITTYQKTFEAFANDTSKAQLIKNLQGGYGSLDQDSNLRPSYGALEQARQLCDDGTHLKLGSVIFAGVQFAIPDGASNVMFGTEPAASRDDSGAVYRYYRVGEAVDKEPYSYEWRITPYAQAYENEVVLSYKTAEGDTVTENWTVIRQVNPGAMA